MRRAGLAPLALAALVAGCAPRTGPTRLREAPLVRVGLVVDRPLARVSAAGQFRVLNAQGDIIAIVDGGVEWRVEPADGNRVRLVRPDREDPVLTASPVAVQPEREADAVLVDGRRFRGTLAIQRGSAGVTVVNRVPLEQYVRAVTAVELGFRAAPDRQAVMAQAVAARTYAVRYRGRREALGFDLYPTEADQVYGGVEVEKPEVDAAVRATAGLILTYRGAPIEALFHSTCGHSTEAASEVFRNEAVTPYLRAVSDRAGGGRNDYYCATSPRFRWRESWDGAALNAVLAQTLPAVLGAAAANLGRVRAVRVTRTTPTGRVREVVVETTSGNFTVPGWRIREVLRPAPDRQLLSSQFQLSEERRGEDLVRLVAAGAGSGHGVGMCQWGAVGRSRAGWHYDRILAAYYPGTKLQRVF